MTFFPNPAPHKLHNSSQYQTVKNLPFTNENLNNDAPVDINFDPKILIV